MITLKLSRRSSVSTQNEHKNNCHNNTYRHSILLQLFKLFLYFYCMYQVNIFYLHHITSDEKKHSFIHFFVPFINLFFVQWANILIKISFR